MSDKDLFHRKSTIYINVFGGPGVGKTTFMTDLFTRMKKLGMDVEMVPEHAKELVWAKKYRELSDQYAVSREQYERLADKNGKVNYVVTDAPLAHGYHYAVENAKTPHELDLICSSIRDWLREFRNYNIHLVRNPSIAFDPNGRYQTDEKECVHVDNAIRKIFKGELTAKDGTNLFEASLRHEWVGQPHMLVEGLYTDDLVEEVLMGPILRGANLMEPSHYEDEDE
jgi:hypothetical protein